jgi:uncharacterized protein YbaP (TraB family)
MRLRLTALALAIGLLTGPTLAAPAPAAKLAPSPAKADRLFLWKVTCKTNTAWLLGAIHVATEDMYPLPDEIEKAFADSSALVVEVDLGKVDEAALQETMQAKGMYDLSDSLSRHVPGDTLRKVRDYFSKKGLPGEAMEQFKPWALSITITMLEMQSLGFQSKLGIDKHFMDAARKGSKPIVELESADEQLSLLSDLPDKAGAEFLASTLDSAADTKDLITKMVKAWKTGDAAGLEKLLITDPLKERPGLKAAYAKLFDERNVKMAAKMEGYLKKSEQPHFVVVGAGHLIGRNGILRLLQTKGYKVEQVTRDPSVADAAKLDAEKKSATKGYAPADAWTK